MVKVRCVVVVVVVAAVVVVVAVAVVVVDVVVVVVDVVVVFVVTVWCTRTRLYVSILLRRAERCGVGSRDVSSR